MENFKAFAASVPGPIKPITLLCGANSAEKSSYLQALQTYAELLTTGQLNSTGLLVGNWIHGRQAGTTIKLAAAIRLNPDE